MKMLKTDETLDRLSELHESLIFQILSSLPMRDVVRTTVLSKRWKDLWISVPTLNFLNHNYNSRDFINRSLMLWKGPGIKKLRFRFEGVSFNSSLFLDMDLWLRYAKDKEVEELSLEIPCIMNPVYQLPHCIYSCSSIIKLRIFGCDLRIRGDLHWPHLKCLFLNGMSFAEDVIDQIVSSCPQLQVFSLCIYGIHQNLIFRSTSLKVLRLYANKWQPSMLTISTPNLDSLFISGGPFSHCLLMDVSSVTRVILDFMDMWFDVLDKTLTEIIPVFTRANTISFSAPCYKTLVVMKDRYVVPLSMGAKLLKFTCGPIKLNEIVGILEIFPKLESLIIQRKYDSYPISHLERQQQQSLKGDNGSKSIADMLKPFLRHMKSVDIAWLVYEASMFEFIELLLKHATVLEKIVIQKSGKEMIASEDMFLVARKSVSLQKSFPAVEIILCK